MTEVLVIPMEAVSAADEAEPLHAPLKIGPIRLQSPLCVGVVAPRFRQSAGDNRPLETVQSLCQRSRTARAFARRGHSLLGPRWCYNRLVFLSIHDQDVFHMLAGDLRARVKDRQPLDDIGQLTHVAWPRIFTEQLKRVASPTRLGLAGSLQKLL